MIDDVVKVLIVVPILFWIGKFYFDAARGGGRLVRWAAMRLARPPVAGQVSPSSDYDAFPPYRP